MAIETPTDSAVITVERTEVLKSGARDGRPWTLYQVHGTYSNGAALEKVKSFDALPTGSVKVLVGPDKDEGWMLCRLHERPRRASKPSGGDSQVIAELQSRVAKLERQMAAILTNAEIDLP